VVRTVFVDTSALLALLDRADARHAQAREAFASLEDDHLVSHGYVVAETLAVARRRFGVDAVITLIDEMLPAVTILEVSPAEHAHVLDTYRASLPSGTSFVDQLSLHVMRRESIATVFALDPDLAAEAATAIP
jgi:predicted nucleic acid-binding protein